MEIHEHTKDLKILNSAKTCCVMKTEQFPIYTFLFPVLKTPTTCVPRWFKGEGAGWNF